MPSWYTIGAALNNIHNSSRLHYMWISSDAGSHACCSAYTGLCWGHVCFLRSFESAACLGSDPTAEKEVAVSQGTRTLQVRKHAEKCKITWLNRWSLGHV